MECVYWSVYAVYTLRLFVMRQTCFKAWGLDFKKGLS